MQVGWLRWTTRGLIALGVLLVAGCQSSPYGTLEVRNVFGGSHLQPAHKLRVVAKDGGQLYLDPLWLGQSEVPLLEQTVLVEGITYSYYCASLLVPRPGDAPLEHVFALVPKRSVPNGLIVLYDHRELEAVEEVISPPTAMGGDLAAACARFERHGGYAHMAD